MVEPKLKFFFKKPSLISSVILDQIHNLIIKGGAVGTAYITENLQNAYLIAYATDQGRVIGTVTLKRPKIQYRERIESATGLDLAGYLERGYHSVEPDYRGHNVADLLIKGLIKRSKGKKIYVTISMDNLPALKLAHKNRTLFAAKFINERTGREIGVFANEKVPAKG
jgi:GNAT superfamily N-acetyltransferase